ncbi:MAG: bifunctional nuclease family protein [Lentisphaerae bacterium]|nr:bifunctional nuclease family protein [Lentisphaerota bacterium]
MIPVKVDQLFLSNMGFVVLLKGAKDTRSLPIFIGAAEAQAIAIQINKVDMPRPLTHDLLKNVLDFLECRLMKIEVCDLKNDTFYARLILEKDGEHVPVDSRPSDAIALALRFQAPIYVEDTVMEKAGRVIEQGAAEPEASAGGETGTGKSGPAPRKTLTPLEVLQQKLARAVKEERYEDAAALRDQIKQMEQSGN